MTEDQSAFETWMKRTGGEAVPTDEERLDMILDKARAGNSFTASDMLFVITHLSDRMSP